MDQTTAAPAVLLDDVAITFGGGSGLYSAVRGIALAGQDRRVRRHRRADGLRQVDAAQRRRRACCGRRAGASTSSADALAGLNGRAGYLFQQDALMPWKTALDNVAVALEPKGVRARRGAGAGAAMARAGSGLPASRDRYPHMLSGGQRKRVGAGADADPRSRDPAHGRAVRAARRADAADHGQPPPRPVGRRPQGGAVRHARSRGGDRARRPGRRDVGGAGGAHRRRLPVVPLPRPRDIAEVGSSRPSHASTRRSGRACGSKCRRPTRKGRRTP